MIIIKVLHLEYLKLNIYVKQIRYKLSDVFLYDKYRGKSLNNIKYSKICLDLVNNYIKNKKINSLILWTTKNNIKASKRYIDIGFKIEK